MSLPLSQGDPRHVRALAFARAADSVPQAIDAYLRKLQTEGVVLNEHTDALRWVRERMDLLAFTTPTDQSWEAIYKQLRCEVGGEPSAAPPCKVCEGTGRERKEYAGGARMHRTCWRCNGSGLARMVALDDVVEWLRAAGWSTSTSPEYLADLFERRFSEPT